VFTTEPALAIQDLDKEMRVEADALDYVIKKVVTNFIWTITPGILDQF